MPSTIVVGFVIFTVWEPEYVKVTSDTVLNLKSAFLGSTNTAQVRFSFVFALATLSPVINVLAPTVVLSLLIFNEI